MSVIERCIFRIMKMDKYYIKYKQIGEKICLFAYLFVFCIIFIHFHFSKKTHLSITDMLPHLHTIYNDIIILNVLTGL